MKRLFLSILFTLLIITSPVYAMICLDNTDTLEGGASVAAVVDYTVHGFTGSTYVNIAQGQLSDTDPSVLYTAAADVSIVSVIYVNTHSAAVTVNLYLDPANAGTPRRMIPEALSLQPGYSMYFDGARASILDTNGGIVAGTSVSDTAYGAAWDDTTTVAPSKNTIYDVLNGATTAIFVGGGAGVAPVWTAATGTLEPVRADSPTFKTKITTPAIDNSEGNITNVGDIALDSISSDAGTSINVDLGSDAGDDFKVDTSKLVVEGDTGNVGIGDTSPDAALDIENGNLKFSTSGTGIDFSATSNAAGMTSELLDDYEGGTWTPVLSDGTNNATMHANTGGEYIKIGRVVHVYAYVVTSALGSVSGNIRITGLPFAVSSGYKYTGSGVVSHASGLAITAGHSVVIWSSSGDSYLLPRVFNATTGPTVMQHSEWTDDGSITFHASYISN